MFRSPFHRHGAKVSRLTGNALYLRALMNKLVNRTQIRVRFSEVDSLRIVWHGNYLKYFEDGRDAFGTEFDFDFLKIYEQHGLMAPLISTHLEFKYPLRYGDTAMVETEYENCAAAKVIFNYRIFDVKGQKLMVTGQTVQVFTDANGVLQLSVPPFLADWKKQHGLGR